MRLLTTALFALFGASLLTSCSEEMPSFNPERNWTEGPDILSQFILAEDSMTIEIPEGHFKFDQSLILDGVHHVTIKGAGKDKTVLSFEGQTQGAEGILVKQCTNITLADFTIEDAKGDNIKVTETEGINFEGLRVAWTGQVSPENGAYGLYPVLSKHVIIQNCEVLGASDAGIYVGQSDSVIIRDNEVYWNVAGIESENSTHVVITGNHAHHNTGGLLIFDLPGLTMYGHSIEAFDNVLEENNLTNFAPAGNIVAMVPPGTGIMVLATQKVHIHDNEVLNNKTASAAVISYELVSAMASETSEDAPSNAGSTQSVQANFRADTLYDPFCGQIHFSNNHFSNEYSMPDVSNDFGKLFLWEFGTDIPFQLWGGIAEESMLSDGRLVDKYSICFQTDASSANLDLANDRENLEVNPSITQCP